MSANNSTLFISDLHLCPERPDITNAFYQFLNFARTADALYILGDFFEAYVGDDDDTPWMQSIIDALAQFTKTGVPTFLMHGNRDFMIGKKWLEKTGVRFLKDPSVVELYQHKILLVHGDSLCTDDRAHQRYRYWTQKKWVQQCLLCLPLTIRRNIAEKLRAKSIARTNREVPDWMDVSQKTVQKVMEENHVRILIHGHTHRPATHALEIFGKPAKRIVLDSWENGMNYIAVNESTLRANAWLLIRSI